MKKELKMELLNSEAMQKIQGGELTGCDNAHYVWIDCAYYLCTNRAATGLVVAPPTNPPIPQPIPGEIAE